MKFSLHQTVDFICRLKVVDSLDGADRLFHDGHWELLTVEMGDWNLQEWKMTDHQKTGGVEYVGLENDGLENDGVEQEQTYILHPMKNFNVYDM